MNGTAVIDFDADTLKVMLVRSTYVPSVTTHTVLNDVTNEVVGGGYAAGGLVLPDVVVVDGIDEVNVNATDITWIQNTNGFADARYAVVYKDTGDAMTSPLIAYVDMEQVLGNVRGNLTLQWSASGILGWR